MSWATENAMFLLTLLSAAVGVWWLMPQRRSRPRIVGLLLVVAAVSILAGALALTQEPLSERVMSSTFAAGALVCAALMITSRNPAYGALWFALVTLCTCGMFMLQAAPFLAAATVIVYAGAIIVTFLFMIMLSQEEGEAACDHRSRRPLLSTLAAFALLGLLLTSLREWSAERPEPATITTSTAAANPLSRPAAGSPLGTMHGLGRSLFGDYLFAVEAAGTLLLVASIGAIAIAPRRARGTL